MVTMRQFLALNLLVGVIADKCDLILESPDKYFLLKKTSATHNGQPVWRGEGVDVNKSHHLVLARSSWPLSSRENMYLFPNTTATNPVPSGGEGYKYGSVDEIPTNGCYPQGAHVTYKDEPGIYKVRVASTGSEYQCLPPIVYYPNSDWWFPRIQKSHVITTDGAEEKISSQMSFMLCVREGHGKTSSDGKKFYGFALKSDGCYGYTGHPTLTASSEGGKACVMPVPTTTTTTSTTTTTTTTTVPPTTAAEPDPAAIRAENKKCCMRKCPLKKKW